MIRNFNDFLRELRQAGFSMGGGTDEGVFSVVPWSWNETPPYETPVSWHTGEPDTDPWEWRMRVLDEFNDIAYGKFFFRKSGFITREWAPFFIAIRRKGSDFDSMYKSGVISYEGKRIYNVIDEHGTLPVHAIKEIAMFTKTEKSKFDRALIELQMYMFITMCGRQQKMSKTGETYGWSSTVLCKTEDFWGEDVFNQSLKLSEEDIIDIVTKQIISLNPNATEKKILKFIKG